MSDQTIWIVDAFTDRPFAGNPAAVCVRSGPEGDERMQRIAGEMNLSETAFLWPEGDGYRLRWLTPTVEVDLCGHATLASAHILWEAGHLPLDAEARFHTRSGLLTARGRSGRIEMDFPAIEVTPCEAPAGLADALGVGLLAAARNGTNYLVEVASEEALRGLRPDMGLLLRLPVYTLIVTCRSASPEYDFVSRFFAPAVGVPEDPVTGSAHCCLGPYWGPRLGKDSLRAFQASPRGGAVHVQLQGERVLLAGHATTILRGTLLA